MEDIAIYGAGGFGKEVACLITSINDSSAEVRWNIVGFLDDSVAVGTEVSHFGKVLGGLSVINSWDKPLSLVIAIGNVKVLNKLTSNIHNLNIDYPNLIHPSVNIADKDTFKIGRGNIIQRFSTASCNVTIGDFNILNSSVQIGHDVAIGNYNSFIPGVRISGDVNIGNGNFFGVGSIVLQQIKIGNAIKLGAGSVLMTKPKDGNLYMGNPAKKIIV